MLTGATFKMRDFSAALAPSWVGLAADAADNVLIEGDQIGAVLRSSHGGNVLNTLVFGAAARRLCRCVNGNFAGRPSNPAVAASW
ncbi:MAG: hypothetical protein U0Z44_01275 [Kouleothrix sp.]